MTWFGKRLIATAIIYTTITSSTGMSLGGPLHGNSKPNFKAPEILTPYGELEIKSEIIKDYLKFKSTPLKEIVHLRLSFCPKIGSGNLKLYKELWYQSGQVIGSQKDADLDLEPDHPIVIKIRLSSSNEAETKASANGAVRAFMDASLKRALLSSMQVPDNSFLQFLNALEQDHFVPYRGGEAKGGVILPVRSDSGKVSYVEFQPIRP